MSISYEGCADLKNLRKCKIEKFYEITRITRAEKMRLLRAVRNKSNVMDPLLLSLEGHTSDVRSVCVSPDGFKHSLPHF